MTTIVFCLTELRYKATELKFTYIQMKLNKDVPCMITIMPSFQPTAIRLNISLTLFNPMDNGRSGMENYVMLTELLKPMTFVNTKWSLLYLLFG